MSNVYYGNTEIGVVTDSVFYNVQGNSRNAITNLGSIEIPPYVVSLSDNCFIGCNFLSSITIPSSVTSLGAYCFSDCTALTSITIPPSVTSIGDLCFRNCSNLTGVYFAGDPPSSLSSTAFQDLTLTIYHKADNSNWTSAVKTSDYGGAASVTWATY